MIKDETRKALSALMWEIEFLRAWRKGSDSEESAFYKVANAAENFVKAFRKNELKIDD